MLRQNNGNGRGKANRNGRQQSPQTLIADNVANNPDQIQDDAFVMNTNGERCRHACGALRGCPQQHMTACL